ncbi:MAG: PEP/pyruvate-binding domain-containing protein, partial [Desulfobacteraceae bacterium]
MALFSKTDSCSLLADPQGPAARRYSHYDAFLDHNHRALRLLAELELLDRGDGLATLSSIQRRTGELLEEVRGLLTSLRGLADDRYETLPQVFEKVAQDLRPLIEPHRIAVEGPLALPFSDLTAEHIPLAGAKAVNLARVANELDIPAADGFAITTAAFDLFLRENHLIEPIHAMLARFDPDQDNFEEACQRIQDKIQEASLPTALIDAVDRQCNELARHHGSEPLLAVRSSAVGEDTEASFAGQYTSVLSVARDDMASAYKTVIASKYSPRAILYRLRYGLTDATTPMAAACVVMIQARTSGVLYTVDPSRPDSGQARIDAALGFGDQVVSGSASPDVFRVDRQSLQVVERRIQPKGDDTDGRDPRPAVTEQGLTELVGFGLRMEEHLGGPQDIEWAENEKGERLILQSRPLGVTGQDEKAHAFDRSGLEGLLSAGQTASPGRVSGTAVHFTAGLRPENAEGAILVARTASPNLAPLMGRARGLITDLGGAASHLASVAREFHVPALMNTREATALIPDGAEITLLADEGEVYLGLVPELERKLPARDGNGDRGPIGNHLRDILDRISPLNLTDPKAPEFAPSGCRTLHDLIRFAHEKAMEEMF